MTVYGEREDELCPSKETDGLPHRSSSPGTCECSSMCLDCVNQAHRRHRSTNVKMNSVPRRD